MKIIADENISFVKEAFSGFGDVVLVAGRSINREIIEDATILLVRSVTPVNKELLEGTSVRFVASATIGIDHIDTDYLQEMGIGFAYAPGSNSQSVAEYVVSALFCMENNLNRPLEGMTLGIVGVGNIGSKVYHYAKTLGLKCLLCDPPKKRMTGGEIYIPLNQIVEESDILTFHVPLVTNGEDSTYHIVNSNLINRMKKNAVLINTSRGKVVDEKSLLEQKDRFGGIVLDVWESEPSINTEILKIVDIGTPHIAGYSFEGKIRGTKMIYDAACAFFFVKPVWNPSKNYFSEIIKEIDISSFAKPIGSSVHSAYDICQDHMLLSGIIDIDKSEQGRYFDDLRKKYSFRREFTHYLVKHSPDQKREAAIISELGFPVKSISNK